MSKRLKQSAEAEEAEAEPSRFLFLKQTQAQRPWFSGGKALLSRGGDKVYCIYQGGLKVISEDGTSKLLAEGDEMVSFTLAIWPEIVATCSKRGLIRVFKGDLEEARNFSSQHTGPVTVMDIDPTGECLATGSTDYSVRVFSTSGGYATHNFKGYHQSIVTAIRFHPSEGNLSLASGDQNGLVCLFDLRSKKTRVLKNHMSLVTDLAFLGRYHLVSVARDRVLTVWNNKNGASDEPVKVVPAFESLETVCALDGKSFITGGSMGEIKKWSFDSKTGACDHVETTPVTQSLTISQLLHIPAAEMICAVSPTECTLDFRKVDSLQTKARGTRIGDDDEIFDTCFLDNGRVAVATNSALLRVYSGSFDDVSLLDGHTDSILALQSSREFSYLLSASKDQTILVWDLPALEIKHKCHGHTDPVTCLSSMKKRECFASGSEDFSVRLWSPSTGESLDQKVAHAKAVLDVCFSPGDDMLATAGADKVAKLFKLDTAKNRIKFSDGGAALEFKGHRRAVNSVRFSDSDRVLCTGSSDTTIRVWSISSGACVRTLQGHTSPVSNCLFMRNGGFIVSTSSDGSIKTWDLRSSTCGQTLHGAGVGHEERIWSLGIDNWMEEEGDGDSVDGSSSPARLVSGGVNGTIIVWEDCTEEEQAKRLQAEREKLLSQEELEKSLRENRLLDAAKLALRLDRPRQLRQILEKIPEDELLPFLESLLVGEDKDAQRLAQFLTVLSQWNTLGRTCLVAQRTIAACLKLGDKFKDAVGKGPLEKFIRSSKPYTERHFNRIDRLLKNSFVVDRTLQQTSAL